MLNKVSKREIKLAINCFVVEAEETCSLMVLENIHTDKFSIVDPSKISWKGNVLNIAGKDICVKSVEEDGLDSIYINGIYELKFM